MKYMKYLKNLKYFKNIKKYFIVLLIVVLLFIIYCDFFKTKEGFDIKDIDKMLGNIKDVTNVVGDIPKEINNINSKVTQQVNTIGNEVKQNAEKMGNEVKQKTDQLGNEVKQNAEKMGNEVKQKTEQLGNEVKQNAEKLGNEVKQTAEKLGNEIKQKTEQMGKEIEKNMINILTQKLESIFTQIGDIFYKGIINPILTVFIGIGRVFEQIFNILKEVSNKIVSLPNCISTYIIKESVNNFNSFYNKNVSDFIRKIFSSIYNVTFKYLFEFIGYITGYNKSVEKCYGFNVSSQVDNINSNLKMIDTSFKNDFGRLDFSKIKI